MRDDPRARPHLLEQARAQVEIDQRQEIGRHHVGLAEVGVEQVLHREGRAVADAGLGGVGDGFLDELRVEVDAEGARAALRRGDDDAAVAGAEVDQVFAGLDLRHVEHALDHVLRRRHIGRVALEQDVVFGERAAEAEDKRGRAEERRGRSTLTTRIRGNSGTLASLAAGVVAQNRPIAKERWQAIRIHSKQALSGNEQQAADNADVG